MARTKKENFVLENKTYYEDLIWMSIRYCIGRKTIASTMHADNIAHYSYKHLSEERRIFNAEDIRDEMNTQFSFYNNLSFEGFNKTYSGFEKIAEWISKGNKIEPNKKYIVDGYNDKVFVEDTTSYKGCDWQSDYIDYEPWMKLANALDSRCHKLLVLEFNNEHEEVVCFPFWRQFTIYNSEQNLDDKIINYEKVWIPLDRYLENPHLMRFAEPTVIKEIKTLTPTNK